MIIIGKFQECEYKKRFFVGGSNTFPFSYTRNKNRVILNWRVRDMVLSEHKKYILEFFKQDKLQFFESKDVILNVKRIFSYVLGTHLRKRTKNIAL